MAGKRINGEGSIYQRKSDGRWFGSVAVLGPDGRRSRRTVSARTRTQANGRLKALLKELEAAEEAGRPPLDRAVTVAEMLDRWHRTIVATRRETTATNYRYMIDLHIVPFVLPNGRQFGTIKLAKMTYLDVDALLDAKRDAGLSTSTRRLIRSVLVQATNQALKWRMVSHNEAALSTPVVIRRAEGRSMTAEQARRFMSVLSEVEYGSVLMLMLTTGMRRGEALGLRWSDVDLTKGVLSIKQQLQRIGGELKATDVKTDRSRRSIDLTEAMVSELKRHKRRQNGLRRSAAMWQQCGLVFTTSVGTPVDPRHLAKKFTSACRKAKIGTWHPHELRHTAATLMLDAGVPLQVVSAVLGHASIRITSDTYGHVLAPQRKKAAEALGAVLAV
jgi:integrase